MNNLYFIYDKLGSFESMAGFLTINHSGVTFLLENAALFTLEQAKEIVQDCMGGKIAINRTSFSGIVLGRSEGYTGIIPKQVVFVYQINEYIAAHSDEATNSDEVVKFIKYIKPQNE